MLAACVQTDSKNENRATKYHGDVSTLVPLKRNSAIKYHGDVNFLTTVGGCVSLVLVLGGLHILVVHIKKQGKS